jgi:hypothetical protein
LGLLDDIRAATPTACKLHSIAAALDSEDRNDLRAAVDDDTIPAAVIGRVLRARNHAISDDVILRHRRRECAVCVDGI